MRITLTTLGVAACLMVGATDSGWTQKFGRGDRHHQRQKIQLPVDYAAFKASQPDMVSLELYFQIYNYFLEFQPEGDHFVAEYEMNIDVLDNKKNKVDSYSKTRTIRAESLARTKSRADFRTNQTNFTLAPGKYRVQFTLRDKKSHRLIKRELKLKLSGYKDKKPRLSDIEFVQATGNLSDKASPFDKANMVVVPSVVRRYDGEEEQSRVMYYYEIYPGSEPLDKVMVINLIRAKKGGKMVYRDSITVSLDNPVSMQIRDISLGDIRAGEYELEISLHGRRNKRLNHKKSNFNINMSAETYLKNDFQTVLKQLALIAEPGEIDLMKDASTLNERIEMFRNFWRKRDPTPGSGVNEFKNEFYRRINYANRKFEFMRRPGWNTARGRVYVTYGPPDQLDDYPYRMDGPPYQEWHYYRDGRYRKFVFVDENEDGEYRLRYPYDGLYQRPDF